MTRQSVNVGQQAVLETHYTQVGAAPVAYLDETYHAETDGRTRFYVMAAVVVLHQDRDPLREEIDKLVPDGWWHTTEQLQSDDGRKRVLELLSTFQVPDETCVIVDMTPIDDTDRDGRTARGVVLGRLLTALYTGELGTHPPVRLAVMEAQRESRVNNADRSVRRQLVLEKTVNESSTFVAVSPGSEHLLWLPDLVCSAYRQKKLGRQTDLFEEISSLTKVIELTGSG